MSGNKKSNGRTTPPAKVCVRQHNKAENALSSFLSKHKVNKGEDFTHTSLGNPQGCFYIPTDEYEEFITEYVSSIEAGSTPSLTEKHKTISPVLIDLDFRQETKTRLYTLENIQEFLNVLISVTQQYVDQNYIKCVVMEKLQPRESNVAGVYKDGVHIVLTNVITVPNIQHKIREEILDKYSESLYIEGVINKISDIYDKAVIDRNNWLMYGSKKPDEQFSWEVTHIYKFDMGTSKDVTELPIPKDINYLVKELSIRFGVTDESKYTTKGREASKELDKRWTTVPQKNSVDEEEVRQLLSLLNNERAIYYPEWIRVGWCLHNIDKGHLHLWEDFSKRSEKYKPGECEDLWNQMLDEGLNKGSLHKWAKEDSPIAYAELVLTKRYKDNVLTFEDLCHQKDIFPYEQVKSIFEKTFAKVMVPGFFIADVDGEWIILDETKLRKNYRNVYCTVSNVEKPTKFIDRWLDDPLIRTYKKIDFLPPPLHCPKNVLNTWRGFKIDGIECESSGNIEPFLKHVSILVGNDVKGKEYFLKWLAQIIQQPGKLSEIALIFYSQEGAGKNIFWDSFANMIGEEYYYETADPEKDLLSRFSVGRKWRLLIDLDEANSKDTFTNSEKLKNAITSKTYNYEQKNVDPIKLRNFARLTFTTNNMLCAKITDNSRRYVVYETSNECVGNAQYFKQFASYMGDTRNQKAIMEYLRTIDISKVDWIGERPITETYNALKSLCADPVMKYMLKLWEKNRRETVILKMASELHLHFLDYLQNDLKLREEAIKMWNRTMFGRKINELCGQNIGVEKKTNLGFKKLHGYSIDIKQLQAFLERKGLLTESVYMFIGGDEDDEEDDEL